MINDNEFTDVLRVQGVNANGYGLLPKIPMQDKRLTPMAKLIYAYFCSFAGAGNTAFPSVKKIMFDLGIKDIHTFSKHRNVLVQYGYIAFEQKVEKGMFKSNIYTLISNPETKTIDNTISLPSVKKPQSVNKILSSDYTACEKNRVGKNPSRMKSHSKRNSINKINNITKTISQSVPETDGQTEELIQKIIKVANVKLYPEHTALFIESVISKLCRASISPTTLKMDLNHEQILDRLRLIKQSHVDSAYSKMQYCKTNKEVYFAKCLLSAIVESGIDETFADDALGGVIEG